MKRSVTVNVVLLMSLMVTFLSTVLAHAVSVPKYQSYINDFAGVIEPAHQQKLSRFIAGLEEKTGAEVAVLTMLDLEGDTIEDFAVRTFNTWKIGKKDKDNGVLLVVAIKERRARIEVGYGLEPLLTDGICGVILDKMIPFFKSEWYSQGIYTGTVAIINQIASANNINISEFPEVSPIHDPSKSSGLVKIFKGIFFLLFMLIVVSSRFGLLQYLLFGSMMRGAYWSSGQRGGFNQFGGFGGSGFGGGFGGFGGGSSGGGGASRSW